MKKNTTIKKRYVILLLAIFVIVSASIWYCVPHSFLKSVNAEDISIISVRDGNTGNSFEIDNKEDITYIVENIQKQTFKKDGISLFRMGTWFTLSFCDDSGKVISEFVVNADDTIRQDPFFYTTIESMNITTYLNNLEENLK